MNNEDSLKQLEVFKKEFLEEIDKLTAEFRLDVKNVIGKLENERLVELQNKLQKEF